MAAKQPTSAQKEAGNYPKEHKYVLGMRISTENPKGSTRSGTAPDGTEWSQQMQHDYGYIRGTQSRDKGHMDVFLGPDPHNPDLPVHVVDQHNPDGTFDEHKVMLGWPDAQSASEAYHANYEPGWRGFGDITPLSLKDFKGWAFADGRRVKEAGAHAVSAKALPLAEEVKGYADGGAVFGNPHITRQGKRTGATTEKMSDYADRHTPFTAALAGLLGSRPDEMSGSVLDPNHAANKAAAEPAFALGTLAQMLPFIGPAARGVKAAGRSAAGAVESAMHGEGPLSQLLTPAVPRFAVKPKGGNWVPDNVENFLGNGLGIDRAEGTVQAWGNKQLKRYIQNDLGTDTDPLLALGKQGRLHMSPEAITDAAIHSGDVDHLLQNPGYAVGGTVQDPGLASGMAAPQLQGINGGFNPGVAQNNQALAAQQQAQQQAQQGSTPSGLDQFGNRLAGGALASGINDATDSNFGGPISSIAMGANPGKAFGNYAASEGLKYGLGAAGLGEAVPYAGSIMSALNGNMGGAAGGTAGMMIGNMVFPGIGGIIGSALGGILGGKCYITTATNHALGKTDDNAYELRTLRHFRDNFMMKDPALRDLVSDYEAVAPQVVKGIDALKQAPDIYKALHKHFIVPATRAVSKGDNEEALNIYSRMVAAVAPLAAQGMPDPQPATILGDKAAQVAEATS